MQVPEQAKEVFLAEFNRLLETRVETSMREDAIDALTAAFAAVPEPVGGEWTGEWTEAMTKAMWESSDTLSDQFRAAYAVAPKRPAAQPQKQIPCPHPERYAAGKCCGWNPCDRHPAPALSIPAEISDETALAMARAYLKRGTPKFVGTNFKKAAQIVWSAARAQLLRERAATPDVVSPEQTGKMLAKQLVETLRRDLPQEAPPPQPGIAELAERAAVDCITASEYTADELANAFRALAALIRAQEAERATLAALADRVVQAMSEPGNDSRPFVVQLFRAIAERAEGGSK